MAIVSTVSGAKGDTCQACNCQFNNVEVLNQLIESKIASGELAKDIWKYQECIGIVHVHIHVPYSGILSRGSIFVFFLCR